MKEKTLHEMNIPDDLPGRHLREMKPLEAIKSVAAWALLIIGLMVIAIASTWAGKLDGRQEGYSQGAKESVIYFQATGKFPSKVFVDWRVKNLQGYDIHTPQDIQSILGVVGTK